MKKSKITVFYSWQSDVSKETNQNGIRLSIKSAIPLIETVIEDLDIILDEATSNTPGSPYIPGKIVEKISKSDVFICDLTPIGESFDKRKKIANPNVLIELGHAIAELGWDRIIILLNTNYGKLPEDLPFDVDKHRVSPFVINNKSDKNGKTQLTQLLKDAIKLIIEKQPLKPHQKKELNPEVLKRNRDVQVLNKILSNIHIATFDAFIEEAPDYILYDFLHYYEGFSSMYKSNNFHIYNLELLDLIKKVYNSLEILMSLKYAHHYFIPPNSKRSKFTYPNDEKGYNLAIQDFEFLLNNCEQLKVNFSDLIKYIRENYLEINLEETSKIAFEDYLSYQSE